MLPAFDDFDEAIRSGVCNQAGDVDDCVRSDQLETIPTAWLALAGISSWQLIETV